MGKINKILVDIFSNVVLNVNQFYIAGLMTTPMIIIELVIMSTMYMSKKLNVILIITCFIALITFFLCIKQQVSVSDKQFSKSMIPHHAAAILMVEKAHIKDPEIKQSGKEL